MTAGGGSIRAAGATVVTRLAIGGPGAPLWLEIHRANLARPWQWLRGFGRWRRPSAEPDEEPLPLEVAAWLADEVAPKVHSLALARPRTGLAAGSWCFVRLPAVEVLCGAELVRTQGGIGLVGFAQPLFVPGDHFETLPYGGWGLSGTSGSWLLATAAVELVAAAERTYGSAADLLALPPVTAHDEVSLYLEDLELRAYGSLWLGQPGIAHRRLEALAGLRDSRWYTDDERRAVRQARERARALLTTLDDDPDAARARLGAWADRHREAWA